VTPYEIGASKRNQGHHLRFDVGFAAAIASQRTPSSEFRQTQLILLRAVTNSGRMKNL